MKRNLILVAIFLLLIVGITLINTSHSIMEEPVVEKKGSVYIDYLSKVEEIEGAKELNKPEVDVLEIKGLSASVTNPGDFISYKFNLINDTTKNIVIKDVIKTIECSSNTLEKEIVDELCKNISIDLIYTNDSLYEVEKGNIIFADSTNNITINLIYNNSPQSPESIDLEIKNASVKIVY